MSGIKVSPSGSCTWTYHATPSPGYWTVVDNCAPGSGKSCAGNKSSSLVPMTVGGKKGKVAPHPLFLNEAIARYQAKAKAGALSTGEQSELNEATRLSGLAAISDGQTFVMACV